MKVPATLRWLGLAMLGILIAAAVSVAASRLASQQIGLASQPISAGDALAPASREKPRHPRPAQPKRHGGAQQAAPTTTTPPAPSPTTTTTTPEPTSPEPAPPSSTESRSGSHDGEHGGSSGGGGGGGGADD
jgi:hypothetical protein